MKAKLFTRFTTWIGKRCTAAVRAPQTAIPAQVIPRSAHGVSRSDISKRALSVLYGLHNAGYQAYLVGGGVRDLLLKTRPKDFDVVTNAKPEQIRQLFRNCRLIGRRFRLAHVHFGPEIVEVATFRAHALEEDPNRLHSEAGMILRDNIYGTLEDDVFRRDFTINALYYNISDFSVVDYVGGMQDLEARCIRMIGDPLQRYREDPLRILRAIRFAAKLDFELAPDTAKPIMALGSALGQVHASRLLDECLKLFLKGYGLQSFQCLLRYAVLQPLFPSMQAVLASENQGVLAKALIERALQDTDQRVYQNKPVTLSFLFATFLWYPLELRRETYAHQGWKPLMALREAAEQVLLEQHQHFEWPKRLKQGIMEIWHLQFRLAHGMNRRAVLCYAHPRFRSAYDFLLLRASVGADPMVAAMAYWWTRYVQADEATRVLMTQASGKPKDGYRRSRKKKI